MAALVSAIQSVFVGAVAVWLAVALPAAAITVLKRHWLALVFGFLTLGTVWIVGAGTLAAPESWWATKFYDEEKRALAADRDRGPQPAGVTLAAIGSILAGIVVLLAFAAFPSPILGVDGKSLEYSVAGPSLLGSKPCQHRPDGNWICQRWERTSSNAIDYRVAVDDFGCWDATRMRSSRGDDRLSGCITIRDHIRLFDRIVGDGGKSSD